MKKIDIKDFAEDFGNYILESECYKDFLKSQEDLEGDEELQNMLSKFEEKQKELQSSGFNTEILKEVKSLKRKIDGHDLVINFVKKRQELLNLLSETNKVISEEIGQEFAQVKHSCSGCGL